MPDATSTTQQATPAPNAPSVALQTAQSQMTQLLGQIVQSVGSGSGDQSAALNAILSAIQARPSA